ncbi:hypothetical protein NX059_012005 [Plenodomus lindquistii]|nr:hypothetical protein NX059_012005 [Plenodomus lindquistii]
MADDAASSTEPDGAAPNMVNTDSLLLRLPGELRNRIYDFCIEDNYEHDRRIVLRPKKDPFPGYCKVQSDWLQEHEPVALRFFYGLTQVCRQVRAEYLLLYRAQAEVRVHDMEVYRYIDTFVQPDGNPSSEPVGNVLLLSQLCSPPRGHSAPKALDLQRLLTLAKNAPRFSVRSVTMACNDCFGHKCPQFAVCALMWAILLPPTCQGLRLPKYIEESVSTVELVADENYGRSVTFHMREGCMEDWMHHVELWRNDGSIGELDDWLEYVGLQDLFDIWENITFPIRFVSS